jgi:hypothetical protein
MRRLCTFAVRTDYPDELGGEDDTADRIADDEVEEIEFDGVRVATDEESRASAGAGEVAEDLDIPSSEDEMPDEELLPYPDALKKTFEPDSSLSQCPRVMSCTRWWSKSSLQAWLPSSTSTRGSD